MRSVFAGYRGAGEWQVRRGGGGQGIKCGWTDGGMKRNLSMRVHDIYEGHDACESRMYSTLTGFVFLENAGIIRVEVPTNLCHYGHTTYHLTVRP
jgi:hypothetical protein